MSTKIKTQNFINLFVGQMLQWVNDTIFPIFSRGTPSEKYFKLLILYVAFFSTIGGLQCKKPTPPDVDDTPKPGKRDYTWTIDTLAYPGSFQTLMRDIYASSPTNVYVVGHNDQGGQGTMFRYDGNKWRAVDLGSIIIGGISLSAVYGFGPNDIYAVGERIYDNPTPPPNFLDSSLIIHFDGVRWSEIPIQRGRHLQTVHGDKPNNVWAGGSYGTLFYFNRVEWKKMDLDTQKSIISISGLSNTESYATTIGEYADSLCYSLIRFNGPNWQSVDSFTVVFSNIIWKFGYYLWQSPSGVLYSSGHGVYKRVGNSWGKILNNDGPLFIYGSDDNNIYAVGAFGRIFHWNGTDWKRLVEIELNIQFTSAWTNNVETFIVGNNGYKTFIIHGK